LLVRNNNSFLVKRDGAQFTKEKGNLLAKNSFKFSGLANPKTVDIVVTEKKVGVDAESKKPIVKKSIVLVQKKTRKSAGLKPSASLTRTVLGKHQNGGRNKGAEAIRSLTAKSFYRADLTRYAIARYHALHRSIKIDTGKINKKEKRARGAKAAKALKAKKPAEKTTA